MLLQLLACMYASAPPSEVEDRSDGGYRMDVEKAEAEMAQEPSSGLQIIRGREPIDERLDDPSPDAAPADEPEEPSGDTAEKQVRDWFPEAFLWAPLVETDDKGLASLDVVVPDSLTTWRVLALAHSREGLQAGSVHRFDSTLPRYVEPVVPGWLVVGDEVQLPVRVVNNSDAELEGELIVRGAGALEGGGQATVSLGPFGSDLFAIPVTAISAGTGEVVAELGDTDTVVRQIPVLPAGRRVTQTRGGTLSGPRSFQMPGPEGADPTTQRLTIQVFPGPLSVLQTELERLGSAQSWSGIYGFALAGSLSELSSAAGVELEPAVLRRLHLKSWQRLVRAARAPSPGEAADLLAGLGKVEGNQLVDDLRKRLVRTVVQGQRADGTWARQSSGPLQQVLVQTAIAARSLPATEEGARLRASGAMERYAPQIEDAYTAAVLLASGLVSESQRPGLEDLVLRELVVDTDGTRRLPASSTVVNAWGRRPPVAERTAWATLALARRTDLDWRGDFAAQLLQRYDVRGGFGASDADLYALEAVVGSLPGLTSPADVVLELNGVEVARSQVDPRDADPSPLMAEPGARDPRIDLESGAIGLAFRATLDSWVPWSEAQLSGVDLELTAERLTVGQPGTLTIALAAPAGTRLAVELPVPAGTRVVPRPKDLVEQEVHPDRARFVTRAFGAGEIIEVELEVVPAFAGSFQTSAVVVEVEGQRVELPPMRWDVF